MANNWRIRTSPVTRVYFRGVDVHVKRDDVFYLAGNKMRKLYWYLKQDDSFYADAHLYSYGGTQSNAMLAIAQLAHARDVPFTYFSRELDLRQSDAREIAADGFNTVETQGNLAAAKTLGMQHIQLPTNTFQELVRTRDFESLLSAHGLPQKGDGKLRRKKSVFIPQGAAFAQAKDGLAVLAEELNDYVSEISRGDEEKKLFSVVVPCGTGTTAFYLAQYLLPSISLFAVPCVGDEAYLQQQFLHLAQRDPDLLAHSGTIPWKLPTILVPKRKSRFGRLWWPLYDIRQELLEQTNIEFDLIYGCFAWHSLFSDEEALSLVLNDDNHNPRSTGGRTRALLYIHTGGTSGNATMLARYEAKKQRRNTD